MRPAHQVYSHQLRELSHGYALWCPEPCLYDEVKVGDVRYLRDGAFHRLFNATLPADHPDQTLGVPPLFQPLILPVGSMWRNDKFFDPSNLRSSSVSEHRYGVSASGVVLPGGAGVHFSCSRKQGALLHLSRPAIREEALAREAFETYTLGNFTNWYDFANTVLLRGVKSGDILFVTGCDKTFEWASAVFDERSVNAGISLKADAVPGVSAELTFSGRWDTTSSIQHRSGPIQEDIEVPRIDQTVFIRGYKILERTIRSPKVIRAAAEPRPPSSNEDQKASPCPPRGTEARRRNGNGLLNQFLGSRRSTTQAMRFWNTFLIIQTKPSPLSMMIIGVALLHIRPFEETVHRWKTLLKNTTGDFWKMFCQILCPYQKHGSPGRSTAQNLRRKLTALPKKRFSPPRIPIIRRTSSMPARNLLRVSMEPLRSSPRAGSPPNNSWPRPVFACQWTRISSF
ncbi:hypothetical protein FB451DRAFT_1135071 [Mycena latifolia]|nr:hypothetical protein FB451DRAFT_1135071 [Mycena latifolia]